MRKNILFFLFCINSLYSYSQDVINKKNVWKGYTYTWGNGSPVTYQFNKDTIINGKEYLYNLYFKGQYYYREDSITKIIYKYSPSNGGEVIMMDISKKVGDVINGSSIYRIDSIKIKNTFKKRFYFDNGGGDIFIEDIGHVKGICFMDFRCSWADVYFCINDLWRDSVNIMYHENYCDTSSAIQTIDAKNISVYTLSDKCIIEFSPAENFQNMIYTLYSAQGTILKHEKITQQNTPISLNNISDGLYLLQIQDMQQNKHFIKKILH